TRPTLTYQIANVSQADITVLSADFTPDAPTTASEFAFAITRSTAPVALPQLLHAGEHLDVAVTAQPNNRTGLLGGHVTVHTSLSPDKQVTLSGNATSAGIYAPAMVDFGAVDIDGLPQTRTIMLTNTGAATLDINSITRSGGGSAAFATSTLPSTRTTV